MFTIEMIPFNEDFIPETGRKYLVKTKFTNSPTNNQQVIDARVEYVWNNKKQKFTCSVDVQNQIITHISKNPIL